MGNTEPEAKYAQILLNNGILDEVSKIEISVPEDLVGEHFGSICESVKVQFKDSKNEVLHLFVKKSFPIPDPTLGDIFFEGIMLKEGFFLTTVLNDLKDLSVLKLGNDSLASEIERIFPKSFHADKHIIVLENITKNGFQMLKRADRQDFHHATLVMKGLGKFHAVSHVLLQENRGKDKFLEKYPLVNDSMLDPATQEVMSSMMNPIIDILLEMLKVTSVEGGKELLGKLGKLEGNYIRSMADVLQTKPESILPVINHGDCWNNNMMFAAGETGEGHEKVLFYDLQMTRVNSAAADLSFYIFTSLKPEVRKRWMELLKIYFETFQETLEKLKFKLSVTFEEFVAEFRVFSKYGAYFGIMMNVGMDAMKGHDTEKEASLFSTPDGFRKRVATYMANNREKADEAVAAVVRLISDFEEIGAL